METENKKQIIIHNLKFKNKFDACYAFMNLYCTAMNIKLRDSAKKLFVLYWIYGINEISHNIYLKDAKAKTQRFILSNDKTSLVKAKFLSKVDRHTFRMKPEFKNIDIGEVSYKLTFNINEEGDNNR